MSKTKEVWFTFKNRDKAMLLELTGEQVIMLSQPNQKIEATRTYKGESSIVGFNTDDIITYEFKLEDEIDAADNTIADEEVKSRNVGRKK